MSNRIGVKDKTTRRGSIYVRTVDICAIILELLYAIKIINTYAKIIKINIIVACSTPDILNFFDFNEKNKIQIKKTSKRIKIIPAASKKILRNKSVQ